MEAPEVMLASDAVPVSDMVLLPALVKVVGFKLPSAIDKLPVLEQL